ncbi:MAG: F0F1 ATP synthase subunit alpha, partial [Planctomycetes bacterium]|nr:F0F1 ATP synthase subunit alpha [Planctomycetota bacterium]
TAAADGVATASGLERPRIGDLLDVEGVPARVEAVGADSLRLVLLGDPRRVAVGQRVRRREHPLELPVGPELFGRVVDPLGQPLDGRGALAPGPWSAVELPPVPLVDRAPVTRPLHTGLFVVDTLIPVGRGQRQLVIGDQSTGKTELCLDLLAAQGEDTVGIYVAVGQRASQIASRVEWLRERGALERGFVVAGSADSPLGLIHQAPYSACTMAESLMRRGWDVVIVYDDLTTHAHAHRSLALLLGRPVGREAFPVDVFYAHARLLERATQLGPSRGGGSLTAFPVVETQGGDLTGYVPTNLVSITDGQIRLDAGLAAAGQTPAVDVGLSVSRVGGKAQPKALKQLAGQLKNDYAQFLELEIFTRLGTRLEEATQRVIDRGRRVREALKQPQGEPLDLVEVVLRVALLRTPEVVAVPLATLPAALAEAVDALRRRDPELARDIAAGRPLDPERLASTLTVGRAVLAAATPKAPA